MRSALISIGMLAFVTFGAGSASAQSVGIYVGPDPDYAYENSYGYGPSDYGYESRAYGYSRGYVEPQRIRPAGHCGEYRFWDGDTCVDARDR